MNLPEEFDYIDLSQEEFDSLCDTDPVLARYRDRRIELQQSAVRYDEERARVDGVINTLENRAAELRGELRSVDRQLRESRGELSSWVCHEKTTRRKLTELATSYERREKALLHNEMSKRLRAMGRDVKRSVRGRIKKGTTVRSFDNPKETFGTIQDFPPVTGAQSQLTAPTTGADSDSLSGDSKPT